jgi:acyl-[acyl-carrier-protein]-phospholipid O-acyltransferase / long-chain-fatty-acid--[acyl-carrier-protein] ligase
MSPEIVEGALGAVDVDPPPDVPLPPLPHHWRSLPRAFVHRARAQPRATAIADSTGASLSYGQTLLRALALGRVLARRLGPAPRVGLMIPPTAPAAVANLAVTLWGKVPVNLNYTASQEVIDSAIDQAGLTHVLTARKALERFKLQPQGTLLFLEDLPAQVTARDKLWAAAVAKLVPIAALGAFLPGLRGDHLEAEATVIFTSGSTGDPKGVVLSHRNILSNAHAVGLHLSLLPEEVLLGILPLFHSMGFTVTLWMVLCLGKTTVFHFNPLDARIVGHLCREHKVTLLIATPTFLRTYLQRCDREQFATVKRVVLGAEKLKPELARDIRQALAVEPLEGYGCTETAPVVSVNVDHDKVTRDGRTIPGNRPGTVGMPLPGTAIRTVDPETGAVGPRGQEGVIQVKGPQVMAGYLDRPEATAKVLRDGWYETGDIGRHDADGFLTITDRMSRFSKIGGEMVPHLKVEAALLEATGADEMGVAVTALPDPRRGERLVVVHTALGMPVAEVCRRLAAGPLPRLWIPAADSFLEVEALPVLGTGKLDLRRLRRLAQERLGDA